MMKRNTGLFLLITLCLSIYTNCASNEQRDNSERVLALLAEYQDVFDADTYQRIVDFLSNSDASVFREPRPEQQVIETEQFLPTQDESQVEYIPKSINIENDLTVGGDTDIQGNLTVQGSAPGSKPLENILQVTTGIPQNNQEFNSVKAAVDSIGTTFPAGERYVVKVAPGVYSEDPITIPPGVFVFGEERGSVTIQPNNPNADLLTMLGDCGVKGMTLSGVTGVGNAAIRFTSGGLIGVNDIAFGNNYYQVVQTGTSSSSISILRDISILPDSDFERAFAVETSATDMPALMVSSEMRFAISGNQQLDFEALYDMRGPRTFWVGESISTGTVIGTVPGSNSHFGVHVQDGANVTIESMIISGYPTAVSVPNIGPGGLLEISDILIRNTPSGGHTISIENPNTLATISGELDSSKLNFANNPQVGLSVIDITTARLVTIGERLAGDRVDDITNISEQFNFGSTTGVILDNFDAPKQLVPNSPNTGEVTIPAGNGYVSDSFSGKAKFVEWPETVLGPFTADSNISIGIDNTGSPTTNISAATEQILLGSVVTDGNQDIAFVKQTPRIINHTDTRVEAALRLAFKNIIDSGLIVSKNGTTQLDVTSGTYVFGVNVYNPSGGNAVQWGQYFFDTNGVLQLESNSFSKDTVPSKYNPSSGGLNSIPSGKFARHVFYVVGEGANEQYILQYGRVLFDTVTDAKNGSIPPKPSLFSGNVALIASIIVDENGDIQGDVIDERPQSVGAASQVTNVSDHGNLSGLLDDDHPQYFLVSGGRAMSGSIDLSGNDLQNVRNIDVDPATGAEGINIGNTTGNAIAINSGGAMTIKGDDGSMNINSGNFMVDGATGDVTATGNVNMSGSGNIDMNGGNVTDANTVTTNDNRDLTLDPGASNDLFVQNLRSDDPDDAILVYNTSSGEVTQTTDPSFSTASINTINATTVNTDNLDPNTSSSITLSGPIDANGNAIEDTSGSSLNLGASGSGVTIATGDDLSIGGNNITNVGTVDGVDVDSHASRHLPSGSDALTTTAPVTISATGSNAEGGADSFARSDHVHFHGNLDSVDGGGTELHATATTSKPGFVSASDQQKLNNLANDADATYVNESGDTMTGTLSFNIGSGNAINVNSGNATIDSSGNASFGTLSAGATTLSGALSMSNQNINNVAEITATTASVGTLDNDGSAISLGDNLDVGTNVLTSSGSVTVNYENDGGTSGTFDVQQNGTSAFTVSNTDVTIGGTRNFAAPSSVQFSGITGGLLRADGSGNLSAASTITDAEHGSRSGGSLHATATTTTAGFLSASDKQRIDNLDSDFVNESGDTMTGTLAFNISSGNAINVNSGNATIDSSGNASFGTLSAGATTLSGALSMSNQNINNVAEITATTASVGTLDNDGSLITVGDNVALGSNSLSTTGNVSAGSVTTSTINTASGSSNNLSLNPDGTAVDFNSKNIINGGTLSAGATTLSGALSMSNQNINNVAEITATTASVGTLDNDGSAISLGDNIDVGTNVLTSSGSVTVNYENDGGTSGTFDVQQNGTSAFTVSNAGVTIGGTRNFTAPSSVQFSGITGGLLRADGSGNLSAASSIADDEHGARGRTTSGGSLLHDTATTSTAGFLSASDKQRIDNLDSDFVNESGDTMTGTLSFNIGSGNAINVNSGNATIDSSGNASFGTLSAGATMLSGALNMGGNNIDNAGTIDTNNNRNLILDPGSSRRLQFQNMPSQENNVLTIDSSGNIGTSSNDSSNIGVSSGTAIRAFFMNSDQSNPTDISVGTNTIIVPFDDSIGATGTFDNSTHQYTAPESGLYFAWSIIGWETADVQADRFVRILVNGSAPTGVVSKFEKGDPNNQDEKPISIGGVLSLSSGDTVEVEVQGGASGDEILPPFSNFSIYRIA